jgi:Cytochrome P450
VQSLASEHLQELDNLVGSEREKQEEVIKATMGTMYLGEASCYNGSGTRHLVDLFLAGLNTVRVSCNPVYFLLSTIMKTVSAMNFFILALTLFPQVQRRAQAELDVVVGRDRLPTFDDRPRLPYIEALCKELMRWQMVTPMGTVRSLL